MITTAPIDVRLVKKCSSFSGSAINGPEKLVQLDLAPSYPGPYTSLGRGVSREVPPQKHRRRRWVSGTASVGA